MIFLFTAFYLNCSSINNNNSVLNSKIKIKIFDFLQPPNLQNESDKTIYIDNDNEEEKLKRSPMKDPSFDDNNVACSSKATSVIRMASQAASVDMKRTPRNPLANVKLPYNRPPKKLFVKLKKPFVPVIEEEANLHPPENRTNSTADSFNTNIESACSRHDAKDSMLEHSEDFPYSPIRQSYTPQLPIDQYQDVDEENEVASTEILETKYVPVCSYKLNSNASLTNPMCFKETAEPDCNQPCSDHNNEVIVFEISIEDSKEHQNAENDSLWEVNKEKLKMENQLDNDLVMPGTSSCNIASTSLSFTSDPTSTHLTQNNLPNPDSQSLSYRLPKFHRNDEDYVCTGNNQLSPLEGDASTLNLQFNSKCKYNSLESERRTSYMNVDRCKNTSSTDRAPSADSLNIITDEKMPAKGEISEQESNGDIESSWSHQVSILHTRCRICCYIW